jgi:hypothetical protein
MLAATRRLDDFSLVTKRVTARTRAIAASVFGLAVNSLLQMSRRPQVDRGA